MLLWRPAIAVFILAVALGLANRDAGHDTFAEGGKQGDVNCDSAVNSVDSLQILRSVAGLSTSAACLADAGDGNCDGAVNSVDSLRILRYVAGLTNTTPDGCVAIGEPLGPPPTSYELIQEALEDGHIDQETAIVYDFFAAFDDPRLPDEYRGDDSGVPENPALRKLPPLWDGLSQDTRALLMPFLRTPAEPGSWYTPQGAGAATGIEWGTVAAVSRPVKVWWETRFPEDEARAQQIADAIDSHIWPTLTAVMAKDPLADCGADCASGGGDPSLDIYLVASGASNAYTQWNPPDQPTCENTAAFIVMLRGESLSTVAHEFMHAIQYAFPYANGDGCDEYDWWWEATGTWAEDHTYPVNQEEQAWAPLYLQTTHQPLEETSGNRKYGDYLFPFYLARVRNLPALIGDIFVEFETESDSIEAIDSALKQALIVKGFDEVWPDFALKNWNREPVTTYQGKDDLSAGAVPVAQEVPVDEIELEEAEVEHLAAVYFKFTFDPDVRTVVFKNTLTGTDHASVWAIKKVRGEWKDPEDWSDENEKEFCFDRPSEDLGELIIIISNSNAVDKRKLEPSSLPTIEGKEEGCSGWEGFVTVEGAGQGGEFHTPDTTHNGMYTATTEGLRLEQRPDTPWYVYHLVAGTTRWTASGTRADSCGDGGTVSGELNYDFASEFGQEWFTGRLFLDPFDDSIYDIYITGSDPDAVEVWDCPPPDDGFSGEHPWGPGLTLIPNRTESRDLPLAGQAGSRVAEGEFTLTEYSGFDRVTYRWRFVEYGPP